MLSKKRSKHYFEKVYYDNIISSRFVSFKYALNRKFNLLRNSNIIVIK